MNKTLKCDVSSHAVIAQLYHSRGTDFRAVNDPVESTSLTDLLDI